MKSFCWLDRPDFVSFDELMQLLFSFDRSMRVEKTLIQALASQLSSLFEGFNSFYIVAPFNHKLGLNWVTTL
jgi:hypothetical protein